MTVYMGKTSKSQKRGRKRRNAQTLKRRNAERGGENVKNVKKEGFGRTLARAWGRIGGLGKNSQGIRLDSGHVLFIPGCGAYHRRKYGVSEKPAAAWRPSPGNTDEKGYPGSG